jgi:osmotically-inducible protein OsmY
LQDAELGERVLAALRESGRLPLKVVSVVADRFGQVLLSGDLSTYFLKQAAQTIVARVPGVVAIDNAIRVSGEPCLSADGSADMSAS